MLKSKMERRCFLVVLACCYFVRMLEATGNPADKECSISASENLESTTSCTNKLFDELEHIDRKFANTKMIYAAADQKWGNRSDEDDTEPLDLFLLDLEKLSSKVKDETDKLRTALEDTGFFLINNHGVAKDLINELIQHAKDVNKLSQEEKQKLVVNTTGVVRGLHSTPSGTFIYTFGPPDEEQEYGVNIYPRHLAEPLKTTLSRYYAEMERIERTLLQSIAKALGFSDDDEDILIRKKGKHRGLLSLNYSPDNKKHNRVRVSPHTDWGVLTILYPEQGLELIPKRIGEYRAVSADGSFFVVNVADALERWTNGRLVSSIHAVRRWQDRERVSIPFFGGQCLHPMDNSEITSIIREGETEKYPPISHRQFIANHWQSFLNHGKHWKEAHDSDAKNTKV
jgi:isopenicillin N synthase-like dioxygenase